MKNIFNSRLLSLVLSTAVSTTALADTPPNMLVIGTDVSAIPTLDPAALNARTVSELVSNLYDRLVQLDPDDLQTVQPMLAESWTVAEDGTSITIKIREGMTFASGNPITAEDAAWSIQRVILMGQVGATDFRLWGFSPENVKDLVRAEDAQTLVIDLPEQVSTDLVLFSLAGSSMGIIDSKEAMENEVDGDLAAAWLKGNAAESGPFSLVEWRPNDLVMTQRNDNYWQGAPEMQRVIMRHVPESGNLRLQLENGDVDIGHYVGAGDLEALAVNEDIEIQNTPGFGFYYIALNQKDPDLSKPKVREAFRHMLDWRGLAEANMRFNGTPWQSIIPQGMAGAPAEFEAHYEYDPEKAKALLAEAGYPDGLKKTLYPAGDTHLLNVESLQATAALAGVELEVVPGNHVPEFRAREFEVYMGNSGGRLPDPFATATHYAYNPDNSDEAQLSGYYMWRTAWDVPELTALTDASKRESDPEKRRAIFEEMDKLYRELYPSLIVFYQRIDPYVVRSNIEGYIGHPTWTTRWDQVTKN